MTISKTAWQSFLRRYQHCIEPNAETGVTKKDVELKVDIQLCVNDVLAQLRGTSISYWKHDDGTIHRSTCRDFLERVFFDVFDVLTRTGVEVYVVCLDAYNMRMPEKLATSIKRSKRARPEDAPEQLEIPAGQNFYFLDRLPMPGPIDMIFNTPAAKLEFYEYITLFFTDISRERIPPGKRIIFSGGVRLDLSNPGVYANLPPLEITRDEWNPREDWYSPHIREGDIDVWYWVYRFPEMNFHVHSYDADVILIGMLQMRRLLKKSPTRRGWVVTRRSVASQEPDERHARNLEKQRCLRKETYDTVLTETQDASKAYVAAGGSFSESEPNRSRRPSWVLFFIDLVSVYYDIIRDAIEHGSDANFVEVYVLALILSSEDHDYIQTKTISHNVGCQFVWGTFEKNMHRFRDLVNVYKHDMIDDNRTFYYAVDKQVLNELIRAYYREKAHCSIKAEKKTEAQRLDAVARSFTTNMLKNGPSESQVWVVASQCAWLLQYWGNGPVPNYVCVNGTQLDEDGHSVYGYTSLGWAEKVLEKGTKRICPPVRTAAASSSSSSSSSH